MEVEAIDVCANSPHLKTCWSQWDHIQRQRMFVEQNSDNYLFAPVWKCSQAKKKSWTCDQLKCCWHVDDRSRLHRVTGHLPMTSWAENAEVERLKVLNNYRRTDQTTTCHIISEPLTDWESAFFCSMCWLCKRLFITRRGDNLKLLVHHPGENIKGSGLVICLGRKFNTNMTDTSWMDETWRAASWQSRLSPTLIEDNWWWSSGRTREPVRTVVIYRNMCMSCTFPTTTYVSK